jgi:hypothetical protein
MNIFLYNGLFRLFEALESKTAVTFRKFKENSQIFINIILKQNKSSLFKYSKMD